MASKGVDAMRFLPSALNVEVMKYKQARVNGGSNYDSLHLMNDVHEWNTAIPSVPIYYLAKNHSDGNELGIISGGRRPFRA